MKTKDLILQKTFGLLQEKGYDGVSVSDIQQSSGMARGLLYHYFGNRDRLFCEAVGKYLTGWYYTDREEAREKLAGELITLCIEHYNHLGRVLTESFGEAIRLSDVEILFFETKRHHEAFAVTYQTLREDRFMMWKTALLNSFSVGEIRSGLNLESVARHFVYIQDGALMDEHAGKNIAEVVCVMNKGLRDFFEMIRR